MRIENEKRKEETKLILRVYKPADCKALTELFYETVHSVNTKDYTKEQVDAWADGNVDSGKMESVLFRALHGDRRRGKWNHRIWGYQ